MFYTFHVNIQQPPCKKAKPDIPEQPAVTTLST